MDSVTGVRHGHLQSWARLGALTTRRARMTRHSRLHSLSWPPRLPSFDTPVLASTLRQVRRAPPGAAHRPW